MLTPFCDHCKAEILRNDVVYELSALSAPGQAMHTNQLHWRCVPAFGRQETAVLSWDWREQPDMEALQRALNAIAGLHVEDIDTGSDQFAIVISAQDRSREEFEEIWRKHQEGNR